MGGGASPEAPGRQREYDSNLAAIYPCRLDRSGCNDYQGGVDYSRRGRRIIDRPVPTHLSWQRKSTMSSARELVVCGPRIVVVLPGLHVSRLGRYVLAFTVRSKAALLAVTLLCLATCVVPPLEAIENKEPANPTAALKAGDANEKEAPAKPPAPAAPEPGVHPLSLSGRALNSDGKPIEGATIFIVSTNGIDRSLGKTTTDQEGRYSFREIPLPVPVRDNKDFFTSANFQIFGRAPGHAFAWRGMKTICLDPRFERSARTP